MNTLFTFQTYLFGANRSPVITIKGSREWIEQFISIGEFSQPFGGYILWSEPKEYIEEMPGEALGVWGNRKASKLRRILRERGAVFDVIEGGGHSQELSERACTWPSREQGRRSTSTAFKNVLPPATFSLG